MYNNPDELEMFLMEQSAMQRRRAIPPMATPFPMGMYPGMGYAPASYQGVNPEQAPAQWPAPKLPSIRQFMPQQAQMPSPVNYQSANDALTQQVVPRPGMPQMNGGGMNPMSMALLAAGMRMLQASGPSTRKTSLGQIVGTGGMEGLNVYAQQRHQQFQEGQMAENSELRREQIGDMRLTREAQRAKMEADASERQRLTGLMQKYQQAVQSGNPEAAMAVAREMYPEEVVKAGLKQQAEQNPWSGITPSQYTNESLAAYQNSISKGDPDRSLLVADPRQTRAAGAATTQLKIDNYLPASEEAQKDFIKSTRVTYDQLKQAPSFLKNIEAAKALVPGARGFMGPGGETLMEATKFLNNRLGMSIGTEGVKNAEELRSRIFFNIMDNLKKMDAQPSQQQQQVMQESLGKLGTDPNALPAILDAFADVIRDKVDSHNNEVAGAVRRGVKFPYDPTINLPARQKQGNALPGGWSVERTR